MVEHEYIPPANFHPIFPQFWEAFLGTWAYNILETTSIFDVSADSLKIPLPPTPNHLSIIKLNLESNSQAL